MSSITLVGPGRAGLSLALALAGGGHDIVAVVARDLAAAEKAATATGAEVYAIDASLPACDLLVIAVRDDAIADVAAAVDSQAAAAVHLSGLAGLDVLDPLAASGVPVGSFHPLQTLPSPEVGATRIAGAWVAVDASTDDLRAELRVIAESIGATPFDLSPEARAAYHAAAAAAANFPLAALAMAHDLFVAAGVPFEAAQPLTTTVVDNAFAMGPREALTGPVARGDAGTVAAQLDAVKRFAPEWEQAFRRFVDVLAEMTGQPMEMP